MIKECKDILQAVMAEHFPDVLVARSAKEESQAIMARQLPLVALITNPGSFDDRTAKTVRGWNEEAGTLEQYQVRGTRQLPILIRVWAEGEDAADALFSGMLPLIPRKFILNDIEGLVLIQGEEHSDHTGNVAKLFLSVAEVQFSIEVAAPPTLVPVIDTVDSQIDRIGF